jgi:protein-L-isoaspartate(D-aspartate) O-methyltransferase
VFTVQRLGDLARHAHDSFEELGYNNIHIRRGDVVSGWPEAAPFDAIVALEGTGPSESESIGRPHPSGPR